jgi:hypothetical protein
MPRLARLELRRTALKLHPYTMMTAVTLRTSLIAIGLSAQYPLTIGSAAKIPSQRTKGQPP